METAAPRHQIKKREGTTPSTARLLRQALLHHRAQRFREAGALYRRVLAIDPNEPVALQMLGLIAIEHGRYPYAVQLISKAIVSRSDDAGAHYNLALALQKLGRLDLALASYSRAIELRPDFPEAFYNRAQVLREQGSLNGAIVDYRRAISVQPKFLAALTNLADTFAMLGRPQDALASYQAALALAPNNAGLHNNLGTVLSDLGRLDEAAIAYRRALSLDPKLAAAWFHLHGTLYDDVKQAVECLEAALRIEPDHALSRLFLAVLRDHQGQTAVANAHFAALPADCKFASFGRDSWEYVKAAAGVQTRLFGETSEGLQLGLTAARLDGLVMEFGVRYGTTIRQIAARAKQQVHGFDTFTGLPEDWHEHRAGSYSTDGELPAIPPNVELHAGLFETTLPPFLETHTEQVRFINIDCDLYSSTKTVLTLLAPRIASGTVIVFDEYLFTAHWRDDEFRAFQEVVATHGWRYDYLAFSLLSKQAVIMIR
jgi:tetratricopeptide (TPR) repeat protein